MPAANGWHRLRFAVRGRVRTLSVARIAAMVAALTAAARRWSGRYRNNRRSGLLHHRNKIGHLVTSSRSKFTEHLYPCCPWI